MTAIDGFRLTFDDDTVFRMSETVQITHQTQPLYLIDGLRNFVTLYNEYLASGGQPGRADSNYSGVFYGFGAGVHTIQLTFIQYKGNDETWGGASQNDSPITKMQELNRAITTKRADSERPALLEVGEYDDTQGNYSAIPVALGETDLAFTPDEMVSEYRNQLTFYDAIDLGQAVDATFRVD